MDVCLRQVTPEQDGYYLVRFSETGGLHLVLLQTEFDGRRTIIPDTCPFKTEEEKKTLKCKDTATRLYFKEFPTAWWSERIEINGA